MEAFPATSHSAHSEGIENKIERKSENKKQIPNMAPRHDKCCPNIFTRLAT
jgi:hypothetical protein